MRHALWLVVICVICAICGWGCGATAETSATLWLDFSGTQAQAGAMATVVIYDAAGNVIQRGAVMVTAGAELSVAETGRLRIEAYVVGRLVGVGLVNVDVSGERTVDLLAPADFLLLYGTQ